MVNYTFKCDECEHKEVCKDYGIDEKKDFTRKGEEVTGINLTVDCENYKPENGLQYSTPPFASNVLITDIQSTPQDYEMIRDSFPSKPGFYIPRKVVITLDKVSLLNDLLENHRIQINGDYKLEIEVD